MILLNRNILVEYFEISTVVSWKINEVLDKKVESNILEHIETDLASILYYNVHEFSCNHLQTHYGH